MHRRIFAALGVAGLVLSGSVGTAIATTPNGGASASVTSEPVGSGDRVTICHATRSVTHPYVTITISKSALDAHKAHQDRRDIVPAPAKGCPPNMTFPGPSLDPVPSSPVSSARAWLRLLPP